MPTHALSSSAGDPAPPLANNTSIPQNVSTAESDAALLRALLGYDPGKPSVRVDKAERDCDLLRYTFVLTEVGLAPYAPDCLLTSFGTPQIVLIIMFTAMAFAPELTDPDVSPHTTLVNCTIPFSVLNLVLLGRLIVKYGVVAYVVHRREKRYGFPRS